MNQFYNSIDVILCASKGETGPNSILEAGACKKPAITTNVGAAVEIIKNNYHGIIIDRNQKSLLPALKKLHQDKKLRQQMGKRIYQKIIQTRSWKTSTKKYKKLFNFVIN